MMRNVRIKPSYVLLFGSVGEKSHIASLAAHCEHQCLLNAYKY